MAYKRPIAAARSWWERIRLNRRLKSFRKAVGPGLRPGLEQKLLWLRDEVGFDGKRVLEIGGDLQGTVARACLALGADHVTSINHDPDFEPRADERSQFLRMDATRLDLPADHYDLVFGIAVLEHVRELERMLESIHRVAKPGAHLFLHGGPLWNSKKGHHVVVVGPSGRHYRFDERQGSVNPLEDWEHRLRQPVEMRDRLISSGIPEADAHAIVDSVYGSELVNRYSVAHLKQRFDSSSFSMLQCTESKQAKAPAGILEDLARRHAMPESEFATNSIDFLLRK